VASVLDYEICLYDTQHPAQVGLHGEFIASARLDNLLSCYVGAQALLETDPDVSALLVCTDHEEVGSTSMCGARGPMLQQFLERLIPDIDTRVRVLDRSLLDVTRFEEAADTVQALAEELGGLDVFVNNAGGGESHVFFVVRDDEVRSGTLAQVNATGGGEILRVSHGRSIQWPGWLHQLIRIHLRKSRLETP
jgi:hypothetical protein